MPDGGETTVINTSAKVIIIAESNRSESEREK